MPPKERESGELSPLHPQGCMSVQCSICPLTWDWTFIRKVKCLQPTNSSGFKTFIRKVNCNSGQDVASLPIAASCWLLKNNSTSLQFLSAIDCTFLGIIINALIKWTFQDVVKVDRSNCCWCWFNFTNSWQARNILISCTCEKKQKVTAEIFSIIYDADF